MRLDPLDPASLPPAVDVSDNCAAMRAVEAVVAAGPYRDDWESLGAYEPPRWYRDAKFGLFIHWGVYSVPAYGNEWYPRTMYREGTATFQHHVATYGTHAEFGYKDFIPHFRMEQFDPAEWVSLFRRSGAQFVVPVGEHHDGFAMYPTRRSRWNASEIGPRRDVLGDLLRAVDEAWLVGGVSSHRAEHWFYMNGGITFDSDVRDPEFLDLYGPALPKEVNPTGRFLEDWLLRTVEVIDTYKPQILYFDTGIEEPAFEPYVRRLAAYYYNRAAQWGREVVITYKWKAFRPGSAVVDVERGTMSDAMPYPWQSDTSVSRTSWCWIPDQEYKTAEELIGELADVVSKNGNLLLNIGPRADGTVAGEERTLLEEIGSWLSVNGEAIYGTRPWAIHGEGPTRATPGAHRDGSSPRYGVADFRFTTMTEVGHEYVYAIALARPQDGRVRIRSFGSGGGLVGRNIIDVRVLGHRGQLDWSRNADALDVALPRDLAPTPGGPVVRIETEPEQPVLRTDFFHGSWI